jgi:hypothetical protein
MSYAEIAFAGIVGVISALGVIMSAILTNKATRAVAKLAADGVDRQIVLNSATKIAEFRQAWINDLRGAMATFIALGSDLKHSTPHELIEAGAKVQLLMNRHDKRYARLTDCMSDFIEAVTSDDSQYDPDKFVDLCQAILKDEWEVLKKELRQTRLTET